MSWLDQAQQGFTITTGDGRDYHPLWVNAQKEKEYNIAEFNFPEITGTLVSRGTSKGTKYNIEIIFQGEDHLDQISAFESSSENPKAWVVVHPYYGRIEVQPVSLKFDNTKFNVSRITGVIIETISEDYPQASIDPSDKILSDKEALDETFVQSFDEDITTKDTSNLLEKVEDVYNEGAKFVTNNFQAEEYYNLFNKANAAILEATSKPLAALRAINAMISYPFQFIDNVQNRVKAMVSQFSKFFSSTENITTRSDKKLFENNAGVLVASIATASAIPKSGGTIQVGDVASSGAEESAEDTTGEGVTVTFGGTITGLGASGITAEEDQILDYGKKEDVIKIIEQIIETYDSFVETIDSLQSSNAGDPDSYVPDVRNMIALKNLVSFTVSNLFAIALDSKQERTIYLENDSNVIILAHRFYGLEDDDSTINYIISTNDIGLNELLSVRKGREIKYYV